MKVKVYNVETGEAAEVDGVDAREYTATGGWSLEPVAAENEPAVEEVSEKPIETPKRGKKNK